WPRSLVMQSRDDAGWLVEDDGVEGAFGRVEGLPANGDSLRRRVDRFAELGDPAVDAHRALRDERIGLAARAHAAFGKLLFEPDHPAALASLAVAVACHRHRLFCHRLQEGFVGIGTTE